MIMDLDGWIWKFTPAKLIAVTFRNSRKTTLTRNAIYEYAENQKHDPITAFNKKWVPSNRK
jgi:hypothetical protein